ncbi:hypothetical protein HS088_TW21G00211 [Tripterygium wilfordii]|uniref:Neprosin PEP catalytic domain-containing protein n=1 Tax=Tripterygium wilfordii TaxID=458696 RepID=A0A7J7C1U0_TRIWF|nr:hypothetical protein HS088_TW21G00211 [Tripterygium wilfordii]
MNYKAKEETITAGEKIGKQVLLTIKSTMPKQWQKSKKSVLKSSTINQTSQIGLRNGNKRCPKGTIPIVRTNFAPKSHKKQHFSYHQLNAHYTHEHAVVSFDAPKGIYKAHARINVWQPSVERDDEFSLAQIWLLAGPKEERNSIEVGWHVYPWIYRGENSHKTRLFIFWTKDGHKTGCYNLHNCPGFVQNNDDDDIVIGGPLPKISTYNGEQYDITILITQDQKDKVWRLIVNDAEVGYWPNSIFTHLNGPATRVEWGGEVINMNIDNIHTSTHMGSGKFANKGYGQAAYFQNLEVATKDNGILKSVPSGSLTTGMTRKHCYNIIPFYKKGEEGTGFLFGGPGYNIPLCVNNTMQ